MRFLIPIFAALLLAACQTAKPEPISISATDSLLDVNLPNWEVARWSINRRHLQQANGEEQEVWRWPTGGLMVSVLPKNRYYREALTAEKLAETANFWPPLEEMALEVEPDGVKHTANSLGEIIYAVSSNNEADLTCFVMLQHMPWDRTYRYQRPPGIVSSGFISVFDCVPEGAIDQYAYERRMLRLVHALE